MTENELVRLQHGSNHRHTVLVRHKLDDLYGLRWLDAPNYSGNLTDTSDMAVICAYAAVDPLETRVVLPVVLTFKIPREMIIDEGPIGRGKTIKAFSTNLEVPPEELSRQYLKAKGMSTEEAKDLVDSGEVTFFRVPSEYLVDQEFIKPFRI